MTSYKACEGETGGQQLQVIRDLNRFSEAGQRSLHGPVRFRLVVLNKPHVFSKLDSEENEPQRDEQRRNASLGHEVTIGFTHQGVKRRRVSKGSKFSLLPVLDLQLDGGMLDAELAPQFVFYTVENHVRVPIRYDHGMSAQGENTGGNGPDV